MGRAYRILSWLSFLRLTRRRSRSAPISTSTCARRIYQDVGVANPLRPARPYFTAFDPVTHDFVPVLEDLGHLRVNDQIGGCSAEDAEVIVDAIAGHHAYWWESERFASMTWLKQFEDPRYADVIAANFEAAWPVVLDQFGDELSPSIRAFGQRFPRPGGLVRIRDRLPSSHFPAR